MQRGTSLQVVEFRSFIVGPVGKCVSMYLLDSASQCLSSWWLAGWLAPLPSPERDVALPTPGNRTKGNRRARWSSWKNIHLLSTKDQPLLDRRDALLLLDLLLDLRDLSCALAFSAMKHAASVMTDLVVGFDVQLDLLPRQCSDSITRLACLDVPFDST